MFQSDWREDVLQRLAVEPVVSDESLDEILVDPEGMLRRALLRQLGLKEPHTLGWARGRRMG